MSVTIKDESNLATLSAATAPLEVFGPDGQLLGRFVPTSKKMSFPEFGMTDEELDARENRPGAKWYTADEVMSRLRELTKES